MSFLIFLFSYIFFIGNDLKSNFVVLIQLCCCHSHVTAKFWNLKAISNCFYWCSNRSLWATINSSVTNWVSSQNTMVRRMSEKTKQYNILGNRFLLSALLIRKWNAHTKYIVLFKSGTMQSFHYKTLRIHKVCFISTVFSSVICCCFAMRKYKRAEKKMLFFLYGLLFLFVHCKVFHRQIWLHTGFGSFENYTLCNVLSFTSPSWLKCKLKCELKIRLHHIQEKSLKM